MAGLDAGTRPYGPSYIWNHYDAMDMCRHPEYLNLHSLTSNYGCDMSSAGFCDGDEIRVLANPVCNELQGRASCCEYLAIICTQQDADYIL